MRQQIDEQETVARLRSVIGLLARSLRAADAAEPLSPTQASILATAARRGPLRLSELAQIERVNPTMLSRIVGRLEADGLLERLPDADDRRASRVAASEAGLALYLRLRAERSARLAERVGHLDPAEAQALEDALPALEHLAELLREG